MARTPPTISRDAIAAGIQRCVVVSQSRLGEAEALLVVREHTEAAAVLFSFAVEEFGKALLLRQALETGKDPVSIPGFYDHEAKIKAAEDAIPLDLLLLYRGAFVPRVFDPCAFDVGTLVDSKARLSGLYVDWSGGWRHGVRVDPDVLRENLAAVGERIRTMQATWI